MNRMMSFLAGAFCGAVVGAVASLLLAPMSGKELQTQTRDRFEHMVEDVRHAAEAKRDELEARLETLQAPRRPIVEVGAPSAS